MQRLSTVFPETLTHRPKDRAALDGKTQETQLMQRIKVNATMRTTYRHREPLGKM